MGQNTITEGFNGTLMYVLRFSTVAILMALGGWCWGANTRMAEQGKDIEYMKSEMRSLALVIEKMDDKLDELIKYQMKK